MFKIQVITRYLYINFTYSNTVRCNWSYSGSWSNDSITRKPKNFIDHWIRTKFSRQFGVVSFVCNNRPVFRIYLWTT